MSRTVKTVTRVVVALAALVLGTSVANAQLDRTLSINCNNLGATSATIISLTWVLSDGVTAIDNDPAVANADVSGLTCTGDEAAGPKSVSQPVGGNNGFTAGAMYTVQFTDTTPDCKNTSNLVNMGQPVHFHDRCNDTDPAAANNAVAVAVLGH